MKESVRYVEIVEWSEADQCFVGSCPGLLCVGCGRDYANWLQDAA